MNFLISLVLVGCELQGMIEFRSHAPRVGSCWAWWFHSFMGSMWEGQLASALSPDSGQMWLVILIMTCEYWLCSVGDGDGGGDFMTGSGTILFKAWDTRSGVANIPNSWLGRTRVEFSQLFGSVIVADASDMQASLLPLANWHESQLPFDPTSQTRLELPGHQLEGETREGRKKRDSNLPLKYVSNSSASLPHFHQQLQSGMVISRQVIVLLPRS